MCACVGMYIGVYVSIIYLGIISLACLSDILVPFQAIIKEVKQFSSKRREIKQGIKALAKTVKYDFIYGYIWPLV